MSRCDAVLASRSVIPLVQGMKVMSDVQDGGHSPVVITLKPKLPRVEWYAPRPRVPDLLLTPAQELREDEKFQELLKQWKETEEVRKLTTTEGKELGDGFFRALERLIELAGGRQTQTRKPRLAYDSKKVRNLRQDLNVLQAAESAVRREGARGKGSMGSGQFKIGPLPFVVEDRLRKLAARGINVTGNDLELIGAEIVRLRKEKWEELKKELREMRLERSKRWRENLPRIWKQSPGRLFAFLKGERTAWGQVPLMGSDGKQLVSCESVDEAVKQFWVHGIWRKENPEEAEESWQKLLASEFGPFILNVGKEWPEPVWTKETVKEVFRSLRKKAARGMTGLPIAVWAEMVDEAHQAVAQILENVLETGEWPERALEAYVTLIPKGTGTEVSAQRPITVLELLPRIFAKGVVRAWKSILQNEHLGESVMGFRAGAGTRHLVQLLSDVIAMRRREKRQVWMVSFDIKKCYDSIPWWALFGVMERSGVSRRVIRAFRSLYKGLNRRFRYGTLDGTSWKGTNGMAQGCPAAPDMLNILFEPFQRWAAAQGRGVVLIGGGEVASGSFADDVVLMAGSREDIEFLIDGYLRWCKLLHLEVVEKKTQVWCSEKQKTGQLRVGKTMVDLSDTFKIVGVVVGAASEKAATERHLEPRIEKALMSARRLEVIPVPLWIKARMWKMVVLPQLLYGCEVRNVVVQPKGIGRILTVGKRTVRDSLKMAIWSAPEFLMSPILGDMAFRDIMLEARCRQLRWLVEMSNGTDLVARFHRALATQTDKWEEPCEALKVAMEDLKLHLEVNWDAKGVDRASWPQIQVEPSVGQNLEIVLEPRDGSLHQTSWFTDGSVGGRGGGAAAVEVAGGKVEARSVPDARSSTQTELIAIHLAIEGGAKAIYSDSLSALMMLREWSRWKLSRRLRCEDRVEVRAILWRGREREIELMEKVKAHRTDALAKTDPKALWNEKADKEARAVAESEGPGVRKYEPIGEFKDAVQMKDRHRRWLRVIDKEVEEMWWERQRTTVVDRRPDTLGKLLVDGTRIWWKVSNKMFARARVQGGRWVEATAPGLTKWLARGRTGALATAARLSKTGTVKGEGGSEAEVKCECCGEEKEDDPHLLTGCSATGTDKVAEVAQKAWKEALTKAKSKAAKWGMEAREIALPPEDWFRRHSMLLALGLIPSEAKMILKESTIAEVALSEVSLRMSGWFHDRMQERESILRSKAAERGERREKKSSSEAQRKQQAEDKIARPLGLTEAEVRAVSRGEVDIRWNEQRPGMTRRRGMRRRKEKLDLEGWVREHFPPERVLTDGKDARAVSAQMLLILWETENGPFPSQAKTFTTALCAFTRELKGAMKKMGSPYCGAKPANVNRLLAPGVGFVWIHTRFPFVLEKVEARFIEKWKDYLRWLVYGHIGRSHGAGGLARQQRKGDRSQKARRGKKRTDDEKEAKLQEKKSLSHSQEEKNATERHRALKRNRKGSDGKEKPQVSKRARKEVEAIRDTEERCRRKQGKVRSRASWSGDEGSGDHSRRRREADEENKRGSNGRADEGQLVVAGHGRATNGKAVPQVG